MTMYLFKLITLFGGLALLTAFVERFARYKARYAFPEEN